MKIKQKNTLSIVELKVDIENDKAFVGIRSEPSAFRNAGYASIKLDKEQAQQLIEILTKFIQS